MKYGKAAIIGAGSTYTPELIEGLIQRRDALPFRTIVLMDIDQRKLEIVGGLASRMLRASGYEGDVLLTQELDQALERADYIFAQIRVGGLDARIRDEKIPLKYGLLGQETTGIGGFLNGLRTVPVMLDIARRIERLAPNAWLINFSNPSGIVAQALLNHSKVHMAGLCNCPVNMVADIEKALGRSDFDYEYVGLNHLSWITSVKVDGQEVLPQLDFTTGQMKNVPLLGYDDSLKRAVPYIPSSYLSYFYLRDKQLEKCRAAEKTRGEVCKELEEALLRQYQDPNLVEKPAELAQRGGALYSTAAISFVDALENKKEEQHVLNVKNAGVLPFLAADDVIEAKCLVGGAGVAPLPCAQVESPLIIGLMQAVKAYERLTASAALSGSRDEALAALLVHPLIGDYERAKGAMEEMIAANAEYLPLFQ